MACWLCLIIIACGVVLKPVTPSLSPLLTPGLLDFVCPVTNKSSAKTGNSESCSSSVSTGTLSSSSWDSSFSSDLGTAPDCSSRCRAASPALLSRSTWDLVTTSRASSLIESLVTGSGSSSCKRTSNCGMSVPTNMDIGTWTQLPPLSISTLLSPLRALPQGPCLHELCHMAEYRVSVSSATG